MITNYLEYVNGKIIDNRNQKQYECSTDVDMEILCKDINGRLVDYDLNNIKMKIKLDTIKEILE